MNIAARLAERAARHPEQPAIIDVAAGGPRVTTFAALDAEVARGAALLAAHGCRPGDAVIVLHRMSAELYIALIAAFRLGLVAVVPDISADRAQVAAALQPVPLAGFIGGWKAHLLRLKHPVLRRVRWAITLDGWIPGATRWPSARVDRSAAPPMAGVPSEAPALITFTSGSTGVPKVAVRTHGFLLAQHDVLERSLHLTAGEVDLSTLPIFVLANLASGVTSVIPDADLRLPGQVEAAPIVAQLTRHGATRTAASPGLLGRLVAHAEATKQPLPFTTVHVGGAPVFPPFLDRIARAAPSAQVVSVYGSTEAEPIAELDRADISEADRAAMLAGRGLVAGPPVPEIAVRILAEPWSPAAVGALTTAAFDARCAPAGAPGEIVVTGAHVLTGYLNGRGDEETKFRVDGVVWHRTGDAGYIDDRGRVWLLGRCSARVHDALGTVYPFSVECGAVHCAGVTRAAFTTLHGRRLLLVEAETGQTPDLRAIAAPLGWARLAEIRQYPTIPVDRRHNAKVDYTALPALLAQAPIARLDLP